MTLYIISVNKKLHIKYLAVFKRAAKRKNVVDVAMLLDSNQYVEYSLAFKQDVLTFWVAKRIKLLFSGYYVDKNTDIMVNDTLDEKHPMHIYLSMLHANINFKFGTASLDKIISRIHYYLQGTGASKRKFTFVWKLLLKRKACPWITQQVDYALQNKTPKIEHVMKTMRLSMFYMVVKNYLYSKNMPHA